MRSPRLRIIPARAGFTRPAVSPASLTADHPRSRGVYFPLSPYWPAYLGSSPLARGLPARYQASAWAWGIIPARAGFTPTTVPTTSASWDHPRSRGVYPTVTARVESIPGSSPLARGLPGDEELLEVPDRIIPARAGFTAAEMRRIAPESDHPRSRGVYVMVGSGDSAGAGSSPLARGLPASRARIVDRGRIIPARAGFTTRHSTQCLRARDHPRSRGVYVRR